LKGKDFEATLQLLKNTVANAAAFWQQAMVGIVAMDMAHDIS